MTGLMPSTGFLDRRHAPLTPASLIGEVRTSSYEMRAIQAERRAQAAIDAVVGVGMHSQRRQMELVDDGMRRAGSNAVKQEIVLRGVQEVNEVCSAILRQVLQ